MGKSSESIILNSDQFFRRNSFKRIYLSVNFYDFSNRFVTWIIVIFVHQNLPVHCKYKWLRCSNCNRQRANKLVWCNSTIDFKIGKCGLSAMIAVDGMLCVNVMDKPVANSIFVVWHLVKSMSMYEFVSPVFDAWRVFSFFCLSYFIKNEIIIYSSTQIRCIYTLYTLICICECVYMNM